MIHKQISVLVFSIKVLQPFAFKSVIGANFKVSFDLANDRISALSNATETCNLQKYSI